MPVLGLSLKNAWQLALLSFWTSATSELLPARDTLVKERPRDYMDRGPATLLAVPPRYLANVSKEDTWVKPSWMFQPYPLNWMQCLRHPKWHEPKNHLAEPVNTQNWEATTENQNHPFCVLRRSLNLSVLVLRFPTATWIMSLSQ